MTTGAGAVFTVADVTPGETVCVIGCGGVDHAIQAVGRPQSAATAVKVLRRGDTARSVVTFA